MNLAFDQKIKLSDRKLRRRSPREIYAKLLRTKVQKILDKTLDIG